MTPQTTAHRMPLTGARGSEKSGGTVEEEISGHETEIVMSENVTTATQGDSAVITVIKSEFHCMKGNIEENAPSKVRVILKSSHCGTEET